MRSIGHLGARQLAAAASIPYDVATAVRSAGWRNEFAWPTNHARVDKILRERGAALAQACPVGFDALYRSLFVSAGYWLSFYAACMLELALEVDAFGGLPLFKDPLPEHRFLAGLCDEQDLRVAGSTYYYPQALGERAASSRVWEFVQTVRNRGIAGVRSYARPEVDVVGRSPVLDAVVDSGSQSIRYVDAHRWFERKRGPESKVPSGLTDAVDSAVADIWCDVPGLSSQAASRLRTLILREGRATSGRVARDYLRVASVARLPQEVWSPTASKAAARLVGLAVINRGGRAVRYGHGGETGAFKAGLEALERRELQVSTGFVLPTERFASLVRAVRADDRATSTAAVDIVGGRGDPSLALVGEHESRAPRRKVLYVPTVYRRGRQYLSASPPSPVYLDWQHRLLTALSALPVDLTVKLHPRDALSSADSPLASECTIELKRFERVASGYDVLVFDHFNSTALAMALCSAKRVVYLPITPHRLHAAFDHAFRARVRMVSVAYDDRNRIVLDTESLAAAVLEPGSADPAFFRSLLLDAKGSPDGA